MHATRAVRLSLPAPLPTRGDISLAREQRVTDARHIEGYKGSAIDVTHTSRRVASRRQPIPSSAPVCFASRHEETQNVITPLSIFKNEITSPESRVCQSKWHIRHRCARNIAVSLFHPIASCGSAGRALYAARRAHAVSRI